MLFDKTLQQWLLACFSPWHEPFSLCRSEFHFPCWRLCNSTDTFQVQGILHPWVRSLAAPPGVSWWIICYVADSQYISVFGPLRKNVTSSTKPEVHNILRCCQRRTEPRPQVICAWNFLNVDMWFLRYASEETDMLIPVVLYTLRFIKNVAVHLWFLCCKQEVHFYAYTKNMFTSPK